MRARLLTTAFFLFLGVFTSTDSFTVADLVFADFSVVETASSEEVNSIGLLRTETARLPFAKFVPLSMINAV